MGDRRSRRLINILSRVKPGHEANGVDPNRFHRGQQHPAYHDHDHVAGIRSVFWARNPPGGIPCNLLRSSRVPEARRSIVSGELIPCNFRDVRRWNICRVTCILNSVKSSLGASSIYNARSTTISSSRVSGDSFSTNNTARPSAGAAPIDHENSPRERRY